MCVAVPSDKMDTQHLVELGQKIGLTGDKLMDFIAKEEEKKERLIEREGKKILLQREREERLIEREEKKLQLQREHDLETRKLEIEFVEKQALAKQQTIEKEIEYERIKVENGSERGETSANVLSSRARMPKLPFFDDTKDRMDTYLYRFETFAKSAGWETDQWASYLSALLKGRALEVYCRHLLGISQTTRY